MASYNDHQNQQQPVDYDLEDWLHLTGWHNVEDRREKLEKWRDIHYEYETQHRAIMRSTFDRLDHEYHEYHEAQMELEMAGNNQVNFRLRIQIHIRDARAQLILAHIRFYSCPTPTYHSTHIRNPAAATHIRVDASKTHFAPTQGWIYPSARSLGFSSHSYL